MATFRQTASFDNVTCIKESDHALLCIIDGNEVWIPKSQVDDSSEVYSDQDGENEGELVVSQWIAEQKGLV